MGMDLVLTGKNMNRDDVVISLENITFAYPGQAPVLSGLDFKVEEGDRAGIAAPNGSGKTTLFHLIMGLVKPSSGTIEILGRHVSTEKDFALVRRSVGLLFQDADDQLFCPTVLEDVAFGPLNLGKSRKEAIEISMHYLNMLGLYGFEDRVTFKLSGGEKRLVSLATILSMEPRVLLLDEPTCGLDENATAKIVEILNELGMPYVVISHDPDFLSATTTRLYSMRNGKITPGGKIHSHSHIHPHAGHVH